MWREILVSGVSYGDKAVRTILVYVALVVLLRFVGKRDLAQLNNLDLVVMLLLSNVVQNAIIGPDNSVTGALFGAAVLLATNTVLDRATLRWHRIGRLLEGGTTVLARDGAYLPPALSRLGLRREDLDAEVQRAGGDAVTETSVITLEPGGTVLVRLNDRDQPADKADIDELRRALTRLERALAARP
ncbi:DUF421 domain-containing protein [Actinomadura flavalba]|uniref:DUF421 domain-containing protein n=1 Tax=Actinomadura flavalba TaxID=1120938 RepID=UPI000382049E|nr:YetF domain-containing protein [Actinomadura flavalba]